jgi:hypothetical protein
MWFLKCLILFIDVHINTNLIILKFVLLCLAFGSSNENANQDWEFALPR